MSDVARQMALNYAGSTLFDSTTPRIGTWHAIIIVEDVVFTTLTDATRDGDSFVGITFPAGEVICGHFTAITLASGICLAYKTPS